MELQAAHPAVPASPQALVLPLARAQASALVPAPRAEHLASCRDLGRPQAACVQLHVLANAEADSATKRPKKAR